NEPALNVIHRTGEIGDLHRLIGEGDHEELVLRVGGLEEFAHRLAGALDLAAHAAAHVEDHADRNRSVFAGESLDLLLVFAFEKVEVLAVEAGYEPVQGIGDGHRHQDHVYIYFVGLGVGPERRIDVRPFRSRWLNAGLDVDVPSRILGGERKRAARSNHQQNSEGESSRKLFAVQHRPHQI